MPGRKPRRIPSPENRKPKGEGFNARNGPRVPGKSGQTPKQRAFTLVAKSFRMTPEELRFELELNARYVGKNPLAKQYVREMRSLLADRESFEEANAKWKRYEKTVRNSLHENAMLLLAKMADDALKRGKRGIDQSLRRNLQHLLDAYHVHVPKSDREALYRGMEWYLKALEWDYEIQQRHRAISELMKQKRQH